MSDLTLSAATRKLDVAILPQNWRALQLQDFCSFVQGGRFGLTKQDDYRTSGVPAYSAAGQDGYVDLTEFRNTDAVILSAIGANCGRCFIASGDWTTLANVQVLIPDPMKADARFLYYRVNRDDYWPRSGSAQPFIKPSDIKSCWIALPPVPQQAAVVQVLDTLDTAIHETEAIIAKLTAVKQGLLHDLLTRGIDANGELRPTHAEAPHLYKDSPLGRIPHEWSISTFNELGSNQILGVSVRGASLDFANLKLLKMGNLKANNELDLSSVEMVAIDRITAPLQYMLEDGDLLFNTRNTPELVGKTCSWRGMSEGYVFDNNLLRIRIPPHNGNGHFFAHYLGSQAGRNRLLGLATGTTSVAAIYWRDLSLFNFPTPPISEQEAIHACVEMLDDTRRKNLLNFNVLSEIRTGLMDDLLTGCVPVTPLLGVATQQNGRA